MTAGIYGIFLNGTQRAYIGRSQSLTRRKNRHIVMLRQGSHHSVKLQRAFNKYGEAAFTVKTMLICAPEHLEMFEQRLIDGYGAAGPRGFNVCPVSGAPMAGRRNTPESNARRSATMKGRTKPQSVRDKLAAALLGRKHPPERVEANRAARSTPEARAATSARMMGNYNGRKRPDAT